ncbi:hypothetical protein BH23ACT9_BH23ACT9_13570 [soil metagenome]
MMAAMKKKPWGVVPTAEFVTALESAPTGSQAAWAQWIVQAEPILDRAPNIESAMEELGIGLVPACYAEEPEQPYPVSLSVGDDTIVGMRIDSENRRLILINYVVLD